MHVKLPTWTLHGNLAFMRQLQYIFIAAGIVIAQCYFTLFHAALQQSSIQRGCMDSGQDCKSYLPGVSCWAADISATPPLRQQSLNNKPSKQTLQNNNSVIHLLRKNSMKYVDLMNTHSLTGKLKVHTARVWHSCSESVICRHEKTSEEKYIPCCFCTAVPQRFNTRPRRVKPTLQRFSELRFSTTSRVWVFWSI